VSSATSYDNAWFGQGSVPSAYIYPQCNSQERSLLDCVKSYNWGSYSCSHSEDAG
ncbi:hypothetical protein ACJMK2_032490, partial [Sinanodonta woodiana]